MRDKDFRMLGLTARWYEMIVYKFEPLAGNSSGLYNDILLP